MYKLSGILIIASSLCAQFTSGTDYSLKNSERPGSIEAEVYLRSGEAVWETLYGDQVLYKARSERNAPGIRVSGSNSFKVFSTNYSVYYERSVLNTSASDSVETVSVRKYAPDDIEFSRSGLSTGAVYKRSGLELSADLYSSDGDKNERYAAKFSYDLKMSDSKSVLFHYRAGTGGDKNFLKSIIGITPIIPNTAFGADYSSKWENSNLFIKLSYSDYGEITPDDIESAYFGLQIGYGYEFTGAKSTVTASVGSDLATDFTLPRIFLPFYRHSIEYVNKMSGEKISLAVGWDFELYESYITDLPGSELFIPSGLSAADEMSESAAVSRIYLKFTYRY
jgi:hypothetical protein